MAERSWQLIVPSPAAARPAADVLRALQVGWHVKLGFGPRDARRPRFEEWRWVRIAKRQEDGAAGAVVFAGVLEEDPVAVPGLERGEVITFAPDHVLDYVDVADGARRRRRP